MSHVMSFERVSVPYDVYNFSAFLSTVGLSVFNTRFLSVSSAMVLLSV